MRNIIFAIIAVLASSMATAAQDGPFGFTMQTNPEAFGCVPFQGNIHWLDCSKVGKPHSSFESYMISYHPDHGICWVVGIGKSIADNGYGTNTRTEFDALSAQISSTYGPGRLVDTAVPRGIWNEPQYWLMSILKKERVYGMTWNRTPTSPLPSQIQLIELTVNVTNNRSGYVNATFRFENWEACRAAINNKNAKAF